MLMYGGKSKYYYVSNHASSVVLRKLESPPTPSPLFKIIILALSLILPISFTSASADEANQIKPIRIGITPVILDQQLKFLRDWKTYLEAQLEHPVEFIQQDSYGKITSHLLKGELDFGWICGYPYVQHKATLDLIATPLYQGKPLYQSYLIVSNSDTNTRTLMDLQSTVFAYSDPDSNSGYLYAQYSLLKAGKNPDTFFKKTFFTWQHRNTVEAVATGLAQAGIIDGYIWETMKQQNNPLINRTRIAHKSPLLPFPPLVAASNVSSHLKTTLQNVLLSMDKNVDGQRLLKQLNIVGFIPGNARLYNDILDMHLFIKKKKYNDA